MSCNINAYENDNEMFGRLTIEIPLIMLCGFGRLVLSPSAIQHDVMDTAAILKIINSTAGHPVITSVPENGTKHNFYHLPFNTFRLLAAAALFSSVYWQHDDYIWL